jgi:hypothetical protein
VGLLAAATMPLAILATRYSEEYELMHAGFAIPVSVVLAACSLALGRAAGAQNAVKLNPTGGRRLVRLGRWLALLGLWLAGACAVAVGVFYLLEYQASR